MKIKTDNLNNDYESEAEYIRGSIPPNSLLKKVNEYIMYYLSGYIVKQLNNKINCYTCALSLNLIMNIIMQIVKHLQNF